MKTRYFNHATIKGSRILVIYPNGTCYWCYPEGYRIKSVCSSKTMFKYVDAGILKEISKPKWFNDIENKTVTRILWALKDKKTGKYETYIPRSKSGLLTDACIFYSRRIARYFKKDNTTIVKIQATLKETE